MSFTRLRRMLSDSLTHGLPLFLIGALLVFTASNAFIVPIPVYFREMMLAGLIIIQLIQL